jgi:hypothetical protein
VLVLASATAFAQWRTPGPGISSPDVSRERIFSTPALPGGENVFSPDQSSIFVSGFVGLNHNTNMGTFKTDCDCQFDGSFSLANIGALVGIDVTYQFAPNWAVMAKAFYDNKHTKESLERNRETPVTVGQQVYILPVNYEEVGTVTLSYFTVGLFGRWQPRLARWYVFLGPAIGLPSSTSIEHNQTILDKELSFPEQQSVSDTKRNVSTADFKGMPRIEGMVGFGYDFIVKPRWFVNPEIRFGFPLTNITSEVHDRGVNLDIEKWKVMSIQFSIGLKYEAF